jgi:hypothetical protein
MSIIKSKIGDPIKEKRPINKNDIKKFKENEITKQSFKNSAFQIINEFFLIRSF